MRSRHFSVKVSLCFVMILLVSLAATQIYAAEYKLRIACSHKPVSPWVQAAQYFEKELEALTGHSPYLFPGGRARVPYISENTINKAIAMQGIQAAGVHAALLLESALGSMAHASHNEEREQLIAIQENEGLKSYLEARDGPFRPEPMGPKSAKPKSDRKGSKKNKDKRKRRKEK